MSVAADTLPYFDHASEEFARDPHGSLRTMREQSWIVRTPRGYGVLSYEACNALFLDARFRPGVFEMARRMSPDGRSLEGSGSLLGSEGHDHRDLRRIVMPWFTPRRIETLRAQTAHLVDELLEPLDAAGKSEFVADVASRIPPTVFCWMVGCHVMHGPELADWSETTLQIFSGDPSVLPASNAAIRNLRTFASDLTATKQRERGDDLTSVFVDAVDEGTLTINEVRTLLTELLSASVDNTTHSLGVAVWLLCTHAEQWRRIADDPSLISNTVEECARFEPAVRHTDHFNEADADVLGFEIPAGTLVTAYIAAAHRDPNIYDNPNDFDVGRQLARPQLEFGIGRHYCIGAALARMEIEEMLRALTTRWSEPRVEAGARVSTALRGAVDHLPVSFRRLVA